MPSIRAAYYDGLTSRRREAEVSLHPDGLAIFELDGRRAATWPYQTIRRIEGFSGTGLAVTRVPEPGSKAEPRLEIPDPAFAGELAARAPLTLTQGAVTRRERRNVVIWALAAFVSIIAVIYFGLPAIAERLAPLVPPTVEQRIGDAVDPQVRQMFGGDGVKLCTAPAGAAALAGLVRRFEAEAGLHVPLNVQVLDSPIANAFALPGGRVYIFRGLIERARGPDELAGVLAHEIGHVKHRHGLRAVIQAGGLGVVLGTIFGDFTGGGAIILGARALLQSSFSRDAEREADAFAVDLMLKAGGDPIGLARFFDGFSTADPGAFAWIASHPANAERVAAIRRAVGEARARASAMTAEEWAGVRAMCGARG